MNSTEHGPFCERFFLPDHHLLQTSNVGVCVEPAEPLNESPILILVMPSLVDVENNVGIE